MRYLQIPDDIRDLLVCNEGTGELRWKVSGDPVSLAEDANGYLVILGCRKQYKAHRMVWFLTHGENPSCDIDHINGNKKDNRPVNLRLATASQNMLNQRRAKRNAPTKYIGVGLNKRSDENPYKAQITINGKQKYLGAFKTAREAHKAYMEYKKSVVVFSHE